MAQILTSMVKYGTITRNILRCGKNIVLLWQSSSTTFLQLLWGQISAGKYL